jgi:N-glycosidase YbiA
MAINFYTPPFYALNNFSPHMVEVDGYLYPTAEHAFQTIKLTDSTAKAAIRSARSPLEAQRLANDAYAEYKDPDWLDKRVRVVEKILRLKLEQHVEVREVLARTGNEAIEEDSPTDYFWGVGADGTGQNQLGKLWMKIRAELQHESN